MDPLVLEHRPDLGPQAPAQPLLSGGSDVGCGDAAIFGVITVSDRASTGVYEDLSGPAILNFFRAAVSSRWTAQYRVIPDERDVIEATIKDLATEAVCSRMLPGYGEQMRAISLQYVPTAVLSRQTAGIRGKTLVINLPGAHVSTGGLANTLHGGSVERKPKSIRETFDEVFRSIPYCIQLMEGPYIETHTAVVDAFRPSADRRHAKPAPVTNT